MFENIPRETLTPKERGALYNAGKEVDHIPYSLLGTEAAAILYGMDIRRTYIDTETVIELEKKMVQDFGIGCMLVGPRLKGIAEALGAEMRYPANNMYLVNESLITEYHVLDKLEIINPYKDGKLPIMLSMLEALKKKFGNYDNIKSSICGPMSCAISLRDAGLFLRDLRKDPDDVHRLLRFSLECIKAWMKVVYDEFGCVCGIADPASSMDLIGKNQFDEFSKPYLKELVEWTREYTGRSPSIHICGRSKKVWTDLQEIGFSGFSVDNCEDLLELKRCLGDTMAISGNVPPVDVLKNGNPKMVIENVKECLVKASDNPNGFLLSAGCQIPLGTPKENLLAFVYAARIYGKNARRGKPTII